MKGSWFCMMLSSLEKVEDRLWVAGLKKVSAVGGVGCFLFEPTPLTLITALALSILVVSQKLTRWASPKSLAQHVVTKLAVTFSLALISAVALSAFLGFSLTVTSVFIHAFSFAFPTLFFYCVEVRLAYREKTPKIPVPDAVAEDPEKELGLSGSVDPIEKEPVEEPELTLTPDEFFGYLKDQRDFGDQKVYVTGSLVLNEKNMSDSLALPKNLSVEGELTLLHINIPSLPDELSVGEKLYISGCTKLESLPKNLHVGDGLYLVGCTGLITFAESLELGGSLYLVQAGLQSLPEGLNVPRNLELIGCTGLKSLPENLTLDGDLNIKGCRGITSLPKWVFALRRTSDRMIRQVHLEKRALSDADMDCLSKVAPEEVQFDFS